MENKYSHEQHLEAVRAVRAIRRRGGTLKDLPVWMQEACREYGRKYDIGRDRHRNPAMAYRGALPEDGVIDWLAVSLVITGERRVDLTYPERVLAVAGMLKAGVRPIDMAANLGMHNKSVSRIIFQIRHNDAEQKILAAIAVKKYEVSVT